MATPQAQIRKDSCGVAEKELYRCLGGALAQRGYPEAFRNAVELAYKLG